MRSHSRPSPYANAMRIARVRPGRLDVPVSTDAGGGLYCPTAPPLGAERTREENKSWHSLPPCTTSI